MTVDGDRDASASSLAHVVPADPVLGESGGETARRPTTSAFAMRGTWVPVILLLSGLCLVWLWPAVGVPIALMLLTLLIPLGRLWQVRASVVAVLSLGMVAVLVDLTQLPVSASTGQLALTLLIVPGVIAVLRRQGVSPWPRFDASTVIWSAAVAAIFTLLVGPTWGRATPQALSILWGGWDHSSHFAIFAELHQGQSVEFMSPDGTPVMFGNYPSLYAQVWALLVAAVLGGPESLGRVDLLLPYIWLNGATAALACGALVVVASEVGRRMLPGSTGRRAAAAAAIVVALTCVTGGVTQLSDLGHTNFLLALGVAVLGSWLALSSDLVRGPAVGFFVTACLVVALLYPPMLAALGPAGAVLVWLLMPTSWVRRMLLLGLVVVMALLLLDLAGLDIRTLFNEVVRYSRIGGGVAPLNAMMALAAPLMILALSERLSRAGGWMIAAAAAGPSLGLGIVAVLLVLAARSSEVPIASSYYTLKMIGAVAISAIILAAALLGAWFADSLGADAESVRSARRRRLTVALAWAALAGVSFAAAGYFGPKGSQLPAGSQLAPGGQAVAARIGLVRDVPEGSLVLGAHNALTQGEGQPLMWDGGDLKNNRWVTSMLQPLTTGYDTFLTSLPPPPLDEQAVPIVEEWLAKEPGRQLRISYLREETREYLNALAKRFPGRVSVRPMVPAVDSP